MKKICFIHHAWGIDGVTRVALNNITGLNEILQDAQFSLIGSSFSDTLPNYIEQKQINWKRNPVRDLETLTKNAKIVLIENPTIGIFPKITKAYKEFTEKTDKPVIYRVHDFPEDRPNNIPLLNAKGLTVDNVCPQSENVGFIALISSGKRLLERKGLENVTMIPNSVVINPNFNPAEREQEFRELLAREGIADPNEKLISYPVRAEDRKAVEEALVLTKMVNDQLGPNNSRFKLIVTLPNKYSPKYNNQLIQLSKTYDVPFSLGEAWKHIGFNPDTGYVVGDLINTSEFTLSTARQEGFGMAYLEWLYGTPVIGRDIPNVTEDLKTKGLDLSSLYNSRFPSNPNTLTSLEIAKLLLSDNNTRKELGNLLQIDQRLQKAKDATPHNRQVVETHYNHKTVAQQLWDYLEPKL